MLSFYYRGEIFFHLLWFSSEDLPNFYNVRGSKMPAANAQRARRALVLVVSSYDPTVVRRTAVENSEEFCAFLEKNLTDSVDSLDYLDITTELEEQLEITIPDEQFPTWKHYFEKLIELMNQG
jgi:acyl carrier protein